MNLPAVAPNRQNRSIVLQAIKDLTEHNNMASRSRIIELTNLKASVVDEHVGRLKDDGLIRMLYAGVYEPVDQTPDRAISVTWLQGGRCKLEIGDEVVTNLTPREIVAIGRFFYGFADAWNRS